MNTEVATNDRHTKLASRGWVWTYARDLRMTEWVRLPHFEMRVISTARVGDTVYVRFQGDELNYRHWPQNYRLRVNYPRPDFRVPPTN